MKNLGTIPLLFNRMLSKGMKRMDGHSMGLETRKNGRRVVKDAMELLMQRRTTGISKTILKKKMGAKSSIRKGPRKLGKQDETDSSQYGMERFLLGGRGRSGSGIGFSTEDDDEMKVEFPGDLGNLNK